MTATRPTLTPRMRLVEPSEFPETKGASWSAHAGTKRLKLINGFGKQIEIGVEPVITSFETMLS